MNRTLQRRKCPARQEARVELLQELIQESTRDLDRARRHRELGPHMERIIHSLEFQIRYLKVRLRTRVEP